MLLGEKLKILRNEKKLSLRALAEQLKISNSLISMYENNKSVPSAEIIVKYSKVFNVSTDYILLDAKNIEQSYNSEEIELTNSYQKLSEKNKGKVEQFIEDKIELQKDKEKQTSGSKAPTSSALHNTG